MKINYISVISEFIIMILVSSSVHSEDLISAYNAARQHDTQWLSAIAKYKQTDELKIQARAALLPNVVYSESKNKTSQIIAQSSSAITEQKYESIIRTLTMKQAIIRPQESVGVSLADLKANRSSYEYTNEEQQLAVRLVSNYLDLIQSRNFLNYAKINNKWAQANFNFVKAKYSKGQASKIDEAYANSNYEKSIVQEVQAAESFSIANNQFAYQTGGCEVLEKRFENLDVKILGLLDYSEIIKRAIDNSPIIKIFRTEMEIAKLTIKQSEAAHLPTLDIVTLLSKSSAENPYYYAQQGNYKSENKSIGLQFVMPLYTGGATDSKVRVATKEYEQSEHKYNEVVNRIKIQIQSELNAIKTGISLIRAQQASVAAAKLSEESSKLAVSISYKSELDQLKSESDKEQAHFALSQAIADVIKSWFRLKAITGEIDEKMIVISNEIIR